MKVTYIVGVCCFKICFYHDLKYIVKSYRIEFYISSINNIKYCCSLITHIYVYTIL